MSVYSRDCLWYFNSCYSWALVPLSGGSALCPSDVYYQVHDWVEWETQHLQAAVRSGCLKDAVVRLDGRLSNRKYFAGDLPTLADIAIFSTLLPVAKDPALCGPVSTFMGNMQLLKEIQSGIEKVRICT